MARLDLNVWVAGFLGRMVPEPDSECIRWIGSINAKTRYGQCRIPQAFWERWSISAKNVTQAHRMAFVILRGPIPEGMVLDHICDNRWCVNPYHADPVPLVVNAWRANAVKMGVEFDDPFESPENFSVYG